VYPYSDNVDFVSLLLLWWGFYPRTTCRGSSCSNDLSWLVAPWPNAAFCLLARRRGKKTEKENEALLRTAMMFKEFDCIGSGSLCRADCCNRGPLDTGSGPSLSPSAVFLYISEGLLPTGADCGQKGAEVSAWCSESSLGSWLVGGVQ